MVCKKCGTVLPDDARVCTACGSEVKSMEEQKNKDEGNNSRAAFAVIGVIGLALIAAVLYLILSLSGVGSAHSAVKKAFVNTIADFAQKDEYEQTIEKILETRFVSEEILYELSECYLEIDGEELALPDYCNPIRLGVKNVADKEAMQTYAAIVGGIGDMQDICVEAYIDKAAVLFGVPELYPEFFLLDLEELSEAAGMDFDLEESFDAEQMKKAMSALGKAFTAWLVRVYDDIECDKTEKAVLNTGDREMEAQGYHLYMSGRDFEKQLLDLVAEIEKTEDFMEFLESVTSAEDAEIFMEELYDAAEEVIEELGTGRLEIGYVYVRDKKIVEIFIPLDDEIEGGLTISFYGKERVSDDIRISLEAKELLKLSLSGGYRVEDGSCTYEVKNGSISMNIEENGYAASFGAKFSADYTVAAAEAFAVPDKDSAKNLLDLSEEDVQEFVITLLGNMAEKGFVPSQLKEAFERITASLPDMMDDLISDAEENWGVEDVEGVVYGNNGLPYMYCYEGDVAVGIRQAEGFTFAEEYSDGYSLEFEKEIGDEDLIIMDYSVTLDSAEEYLSWEADFNREYYTEYGYRNVQITETKTDRINGYQVSWFEYSAEYDAMQKAAGIIAYARLDEYHACALDLYSFYGTPELSEELLYDCFNLDIIYD